MAHYLDQFSPFLCITIIALFCYVLHAIMLRIVLGLLTILASPIYLFLHCSTSDHGYEFTRPKKGPKKVVADFCGAIISLKLFAAGMIIIQAALASPHDLTMILRYTQAGVPAIDVLLILLLLGALVWLCRSEKPKNGAAIDATEADSWSDKMLEIKLPPPLDQL